MSRQTCLRNKYVGTLLRILEGATKVIRLVIVHHCPGHLVDREFDAPAALFLREGMQMESGGKAINSKSYA